jgi:hypothetical protein
MYGRSADLASIRRRRRDRFSDAERCDRRDPTSVHTDARYFDALIFMHFRMLASYTNAEHEQVDEGDNHERRSNSTGRASRVPSR